jgi:hypothetical protein
MKRRSGGETKVKSKPQARRRSGQAPDTSVKEIVARKPPKPMGTDSSRQRAPRAMAVPPPHTTAPRPLGPPVGKTDALSRGQDIETAFEAWQELREHHRAVLARLNDERRKLDEQGSFVIGMVNAARGAGGEGLAVPTQLDAYHREAQVKLEAAKQQLDKDAQASEEKWAIAFTEIRTEVRERIQRTLNHVQPLVRLRVRTLTGDKRILHVDRVSPDEAVLLCFVFTGRLPSRYGFLFDDATDDLRDVTPTLYAEEGADRTRPDAAYVTGLLEQPGEVLPLKSMLLLKAGSAVVRLIERGPVMEAEIADGVTFRNVLSREEAERIAGHLLKLKLEGVIQLELIAE